MRAAEATGYEGRRALITQLPSLGRVFGLPQSSRCVFGEEEDNGYWAVVHVLYTSVPALLAAPNDPPRPDHVRF